MQAEFSFVVCPGGHPTPRHVSDMFPLLHAYMQATTVPFLEKHTGVTSFTQTKYHTLHVGNAYVRGGDYIFHGYLSFVLRSNNCNSVILSPRKGTYL